MASKEPKFVVKNEKEKLHVIDEIQGLRNHPGWSRLVEYYDRKIKWLETVINGDVRDDEGKTLIKSMEELELYRARRNMAIQFRNLPDILVEALQVAEGKMVQFDPYE